VTVIEKQRAASLADPKTGERLQPTPQPGYYPGYQTLSPDGAADSKGAVPGGNVCSRRAALRVDITRSDARRHSGIL